MRVLKLQAENFKRLLAVDITPAGDLVTITGRNAQGKSSVLDALWGALEGASVLPTEAVRKGAERARLRVELGTGGVVKYIATRTISKKAGGGETTSVKVEGADGAVFPSPQKLLDELIGSLSFDPLHFARLSETAAGRRQQFDMLGKFVPGVDFDAVANLNRGASEKRTDVNRRAKEARAAASLIAVPAEIPEKVDELGLVARLGGATQRESEIAAHARARDALSSRAAALERDLQAYETRGQQLRDELAALAGKVDEATRAADALANEIEAFDAQPAPERVDTSAVAEQLRQAQAHNRNVADMLARVEKRASMVRLAESLEAEAAELGESIAARNKAKADAVAAATMPVAGLGFGDGEVLLNGVPFAQGSSAEQLRTSVAIAAAMNPTLRVIHIRDGSLLDADSMAWLAEYAHANDLQVWCEVVGTDSRVGVLIEDGQVVAPAAEAVAS